MECGVFLDRQELCKSAEFAWNKANVRIQEMDQHARFVADLWKRFVVDEEIDCRVNYGFTSKRKFGSSMKVQELNYENIPVIEEGRDRLKACELRLFTLKGLRILGFCFKNVLIPMNFSLWVLGFWAKSGQRLSLWLLLI